MKIAAILLAAGNGSRFYKSYLENNIEKIGYDQNEIENCNNKMLYKVQGKPMYQYALDCIKAQSQIDKIVLVTQYKEITDAEPNITIKNNNSDLGISHSIHLGIEAVKSDSLSPYHYLFVVCDQPFLKATTIEKFIKGYKESKKGIGCLAIGKEMKNPVIFSPKYEKELLLLEGDRGGKKVVKKHLDDVYLYEVEDKEELEDFDTLEKLLRKVGENDRFSC